MNKTNISVNQSKDNKTVKMLIETRGEYSKELIDLAYYIKKAAQLGISTEHIFVALCVKTQDLIIKKQLTLIEMISEQKDE
jgi:predicted S18 family serine protease